MYLLCEQNCHGCTMLAQVIQPQQLRSLGVRTLLHQAQQTIHSSRQKVCFSVIGSRAYCLANAHDIRWAQESYLQLAQLSFHLFLSALHASSHSL